MIETRTATLAFRPQSRAAGEPVRITGYASVTGAPYDVADFLGVYRETIAPGAFTRALDEGQDVRLLSNHDGLPLARTSSGTLTLTEDARGLRIDATLDPADPDVQAILPKLERGDLREMSMAFSCGPEDQSWNADYTERTITSLSLYDVSIVTYPASPTTSVGIASSVTSPAI